MAYPWAHGIVIDFSTSGVLPGLTVAEPEVASKAPEGQVTVLPGLTQFVKLIVPVDEPTGITLISLSNMTGPIGFAKIEDAKNSCSDFVPAETFLIVVTSPRDSASTNSPGTSLETFPLNS